ncbi:sigma-70 family RNA polymerase sigma factor [Streptomyces sp. NPDC093221]|uniref:sigma-70 family RNA polymerase sigma factor n=1 Tax=Streptomyces sp. NPDC093221 TaxID=3366032 RepID=UPI003815B5BB
MSTGARPVAPSADADGATALSAPGPDSKEQIDRRWSEFSLHQEVIRKYLHFRGLNDHEADDVLSDVAWKYVQYARGHEVGNVRALLLTSARHAAVDHSRRQARSRETPVSTPELFESADAVAESADTVVFNNESIKELMIKITGLPRRQRQVITMTYLEDKTPGRIAVELGLTPDAVRKTAALALGNLREMYANAAAAADEA